MYNVTIQQSLVWVLSKVNFIQNKEYFYKDFNTACGPCPLEVFLETY